MNKIKTIAAAVALVAATGANASMVDFDDAGSGSLVLQVWNVEAKQSAFFDLGIDMATFSTAAFGAGSYMTWNLGTGEIASNVLGGQGIVADYSAAAAFLPLLSGSTFAIYGGDRTATQDKDQRYVSTVAMEDIAAAKAMPAFTLQKFFTVNQQIAASNFLGTHASAANGANIGFPEDGSYAGDVKSLQNNWANWAPFAATANVVGGELAFFDLLGQNTPPRTAAKPVIATQYAYTFSFDAANNTLIYGLENVPAIPEADTYAMLLAGLGMLGMMARRRRVI